MKFGKSRILQEEEIEAQGGSKRGEKLGWSGDFFERIAGARVWRRLASEQLDGVGRLLRDTAGCFVLFIFMDLGQRVSTLIRLGANLSRRGRGKRLFVVLAAVPVPRLTHYPFKDGLHGQGESGAPPADKIEEERERDFHLRSGR